MLIVEGHAGTEMGKALNRQLLVIRRYESNENRKPLYKSALDHPLIGKGNIREEAITQAHQEEKPEQKTGGRTMTRSL